MNTPLLRSILLLGLAGLWSPASRAVGQPTPDGWSVALGGGMLFGPAFPGASDYQLMMVPSVRVRYGEKFAASVERGVTYNLVSTAGFTAGPLLRLDFGREADGRSLFRVAGRRSTALLGFSDVSKTLQAGVFVGHRFARWTSRLELLQGVNGHEGFTGTLAGDYAFTPARPAGGGAPGPRFATGPRLHWGDGSYQNAYFGVSESAALVAGLPVYRAASGLTSVGWGASFVRPLNRQWSLVVLGGYARLLGDASNSPLVREKGSRHQFMSGVFLSYGL